MASEMAKYQYQWRKLSTQYGETKAAESGGGNQWRIAESNNVSEISA
jgi:hypothetical protein